jgi:hypothetical protein
MSGFSAEIRTEHRPNSSLQLYLYADPLGLFSL